MPLDTWRYEPLDPARFPVGTGPFRARGLAFNGMMHYVDTRLEGGRAALVASLANDPFQSYYEQLFVANGDYDAAALLNLYRKVAWLERLPIGRFITERAHAGAAHDTKGIWKPVLKTTSPEAFAERSNFAFNRYFAPASARVVAVASGRFDGELSNVPEGMDGMYVSSTIGFCTGAIELSGARDVVGAAEPPVRDGELEGVPVERVKFSVTWRA